MNLITIREPAALEAPACHMLLPKTLGQNIPREYRIAVDQSRSAIIGAAAFADNGESFLDLDLHTMFNRRREGAGSLLLESVTQEAARRGRKEIMSTLDQADASLLPGFLRNHGFRVQSRYYTAEGQTKEIYELLCARCARIRKAEPQQWRIIPLSPDLYAEIAHVFAEYFRNSTPVTNRAAHIAAYLKGYELSQALVIDGALQGIMLITKFDDAIVWRLRAVQPRFRNTRASADFLMRSAEVSRQTGAARLIFHYFEDAADTGAFVRRVNMKVIQTCDVLSKAVAV